MHVSFDIVPSLVHQCSVIRRFTKKFSDKHEHEQWTDGIDIIQAATVLDDRGCLTDAFHLKLGSDIRLMPC